MTTTTEIAEEKVPKWETTPQSAGFYLVWARGHYPDFIYYGGEGDPVFEPTAFAKYYGPIRLPLVP